MLPLPLESVPGSLALGIRRSARGFHPFLVCRSLSLLSSRARTALLKE